MFKKIHAFRIKPKEDLLRAIEDYCESNGVTSGIVIGIIGSLEKASLNFLKSLPANYINKQFDGPMEIASAQGSVAKMDDKIIVHIHVLVDNENEIRGGHLVEGSIVFSTAEVVIGELERQLKRTKNDYTGLFELVE